MTERQAADAYCRMLCRRHYENFLVASLSVGARRRDLMRIYAYCRTTDDLGDESGDEALPRLDAWRAAVRACFAGDAVLHPVLVALRETIATHRLPEQPFLDLIDANVQDQHVHAYDSWPQLRQYCMLSAAPVGRMVLGAFGVSDARAQALSDDVCIGLQLANHAQDVSRDNARGRSYLLQSDLQAGDVPSAVRALCDRARDLLNCGRELEALAPAPLRFQLALYRLGGLAIISGIERIGFRTDLVRPSISKAAQGLLMLRALRALARDGRYAREPQTV